VILPAIAVLLDPLLQLLLRFWLRTWLQRNERKKDRKERGERAYQERKEERGRYIKKKCQFNKKKKIEKIGEKKKNYLTKDHF